MGGKAKHTSTTTVTNTVLMVAVAVPAIVWCSKAFVLCNAFGNKSEYAGITAPGGLILGLQQLTCRQPLAAVNFIFLVNVCVLFWIINLIQGSTWLIDPYWTFIPVLINTFYNLHPSATSSTSPRALVSSTLVWAWAYRLTYRYVLARLVFASN